MTEAGINPISEETGTVSNRQETIPLSEDNSSSRTLQDLVELSMLYDFYSELLGDYKKEIFGEYVMNDMSLSEIAAEAGISRQGVHDIIKRCSKQLREYEEKLGLNRRFQQLKKTADQIKETTEQLRTAAGQRKEQMTEENHQSTELQEQTASTRQHSLIDRIEQLTEDLINQL